MTYGGTSFNDFPENQLNSRSLNSISANWDHTLFCSKLDISLL